VDSSLELSAEESLESSESSEELGADVEQFSLPWPCRPPHKTRWYQCGTVGYA